MLIKLEKAKIPPIIEHNDIINSKNRPLFLRCLIDTGSKSYLNSILGTLGSLSTIFSYEENSKNF